MPDELDLPAQVSERGEQSRSGRIRRLVTTRFDTWEDRSPHASHFVTVNGVRLHYLDWGGSGEPLVLIHGLGDPKPTGPT